MDAPLMTPDLLAAFVAFAFVSSITPGPNNLMLLASGAHFGFRRSVPHLLGVGLGFMVMVLLVGVGLLGVFDAFPVSYDVLRWASAAYLCCLAWKIARSGGPTGSSVARPMSFVEAALFQWVNPKGWAMALTALSVYAPDRSAASIMLIAGLFALVNLPSVGSWALLGRGLARLLDSGWRLRVFNSVMALTLLSSVGVVLLR